VTRAVAGLALALIGAAPPTDLDRVTGEVARAERRWDGEAAVAALSNARALARSAPGPATAGLQIRAGLLAAELLRVRFEQAAAGPPGERERLGQQIDAFAEEALALVAAQPESSERYRLEADLLATMIRSDFRAKKYEARFNAAVARARELDPRNPRALVAAAKPFLFAPPGRGRDPAQGIELLDRALAIDPRLESALLLRALGREQLGDRAGAEADWRTALGLNPDCAPARESLAGYPAPR
jgi:tetratricopeptide (TPR) repeat protein